MGMVQLLPALNRPTNPICSICIANYNGESLLVDCIDSLLVQDGDIDLEIIVHDDASTDGSISLLRRRYPQVEVMASSENVGFCVANNRMVEHARGTYVLLLNNDAALEHDALSTLLAMTTEYDAPTILTLPQRDWETGVLVDRGCLLDPFYNPIPNTHLSRTEVAMTIGACLWVSRSLWEKLGGFPQWMGSIAEDLYLCCVARLSGYSVEVTKVSGYRHRQGASFGGNKVNTTQGLSTTYRRRHLSERNKTSVMLVCTPTAIVWPLLCLHISLLCIEGTALTLLKADRQIWTRIYGAAMADLFRHRKTLLDHRKQIQKHRRVSLFRYFSEFSPVPRKAAMFFRYGIPRIR